MSLPRGAGCHSPKTGLAHSDSAGGKARDLDHCRPWAPIDFAPDSEAHGASGSLRPSRGLRTDGQAREECGLGARAWRPLRGPL